MTTITPKNLNELKESGAKLCLLDVRTPAEHAEVHVPGVHLMPLERLDCAALASTPGFDKSHPVYILCRSGGRAKQAAEKLRSEGFANCIVVEGGTLAWVDAGFPVNRGESKVISLERQVRIAVGFIVLTGVLLARFVDSAFIILPGIMGAGLIFAGVTDWCGMGLLIAKMPWNQCGAKNG
jgi:rhodanese-related sulfurtransferase